MPNVLFFTESRGWSGGAKQLLALAEGLRQRGWHLSVAAPADGDIFRKASERRFDVVDLRPRQDYDVFCALRLSRLMAEHHIDILHAHHPRAHAVGLISAYLSRQPPVFLVTRRVSFAVSKNIFSRMKYCSPRIDAFVAVADSIRAILIQAGVSPEKVATIPSGVDLSEFAPRGKDLGLAAEIGLPGGVPVVGQIAHYGPWKGQDILIEAAAEMKRRGVRAVYVFAGRDTQCQSLRAKAEVAGLAGDVRFLGLREDVPRLLSLLDASVSASTSGEGLSGAIRESLAMSVPCVVTDVGGNAELVRDKVTGRVCAAGDVKGLADAIASTLEDPVQSKRMAQEGRREVMAHRSIEAMVSATEVLYRSLLARREASTRERFQYAA